MKCPKCQAENREGVKFCEDCGSKLELVCPSCGATIPFDKKFCGECGHDLTESKVAPHIDYSQPKSYTPKSIADKILDTRSSIEGERKLVTVLFADVANYTSLSEKLDPEEVHQIMDGCYQLLMDEIHRYEGTIDKFTGDGIMALFGAPVAHEDHAQRACYAALAMQKSIGEYGEKIERECGVEFKMRVGLNSGLVIVSSVGNDLRMDYTAIGDTVNLASRMETNAKPGTVLVSADTYKIARDYFKFEPLGKIPVKGKEELVESFQLLEASDIETRIGASVARGLTRFVGRQREITALKEAFEKAQSGSGQVIGVVGEAGVGKSRLLLELRAILQEEAYTYLEGQCLHYGGLMAYLPLLDILRPYFDIKEGEREFIVKKKMAEKIAHLDQNLEGILPPLQDILSLKVEEVNYMMLEPQQKRDKIFEAIRDLLIRESQNKPLIIAVDDLQWIDKTSEEFLTYLMGWLANARILLIILYRPEYTHQWASKSYYSQIGVDQLPAETSAELVLSILEEGEVVPELRELILTRAAGNPLFMEEFTHTLLENGSIQKKDHQYVLSRKAADIQVPDTIQGIIAARMDRLEDNLKRTMQVASVIGRDFAYRILQTITGMREELKSYLLNLQGLEFIYEKSLFPELEYIFKHALTQEVAYNSMLLKRRKDIHERIGKAIEELYSDRLEEFYEVLAHHYSRSENAEKAYQYLLSSMIKTGLSYSLWEAFRFGKEALNALKQMPQTDENKVNGINVRLIMALVMQGLGYPEDSLQILEEGEKLSNDLGDKRNLTIFRSNMGMCHMNKGDLTQGIKYTEDAYKGAEKLDDIELKASIGVDLCMAYYWAGEFSCIANVASNVTDSLEKANRESEYFGKPFNPYCALLALHGSALGYLGNFKEGENLCDKALRFSLDIANVVTIAFVEVYYGALFAVKGDGIRGIQHAENAVKYSEETQAITLLAPAWLVLGYSYGYQEELEKAIEYAGKGLEIQLSAGLYSNLSSFYSALGLFYCETGDGVNALSCIKKAVELAHNNGEMFNEAISNIDMGRILGKADISQSSEAERHILQGITISDELKLKPDRSFGYLYLGELYSDMGQREKALQTLTKAKGMFKEMGMDYWLRRTQEVLERVES
jgi:class 3 adenylate cyclase/tetratricopeptide (TPR) repeat protein